MISKKLGSSWLFSITLFRPAPSEAPTNNWGVIPITDPKKKLLILTLNNVGKMFEIEKGIPPTNLYIRKKVNSFFLNFSVRLENLDENFFLIKSLKK